jgi:rhamnogalacturonyl hydrolase YesR
MGSNVAVNDPAALGEALLLTADRTGRGCFREAADRLYHYLKYDAPRTQDGILYHFDAKWAETQVWVDACYMVPPFLCKYGDVEEAIKQLKGFRHYLYHKEKHLLSQIWDDKNQTLGKADFWGVGNGWTLAGLTRVIDMLAGDGTLKPSHKEERDNLIKYLKELLDACLTYQREDGLFHNVLDDPTSFIETNCAQMIAYTIYRGVIAGYLDRAYLMQADKARDAAFIKVDEYGFVRDVCGMPYFDRPGIAAEGQAFFLLMEAAARDLYQK